MQRNSTIGELMERKRIQDGAKEYQGHTYMDLARFDDATKHMIIFDVLTDESPVGWKGERNRLYLSDVGYQKALDKVSCAECTLPSPLAVSRIRLISRFSAAVSFTVGFAACRACGSGFRFLNNGFHLLFRLGLPLQGYIEIVCLVRPFLRPQEHTADDLSGHHLQGLAVPLIHGE